MCYSFNVTYITLSPFPSQPLLWFILVLGNQSNCPDIFCVKNQMQGWIIFPTTLPAIVTTSSLIICNNHREWQFQLCLEKAYIFVTEVCPPSLIIEALKQLPWSHWGCCTRYAWVFWRDTGLDAVTWALDPNTEKLSNIQLQWILNSKIQARHSLRWHLRQLWWGLIWSNICSTCSCFGTNLLKQDYNLKVYLSMES